MKSVEERRMIAQNLGSNVRGFAGGHLRMTGGPAGACDECGGPMPCDCEPETVERAQPEQRAQPLRRPLPDATTGARAEFDLMCARIGYKPKPAPAKHDPVAEARRDLDRWRREADQKRAR